MRYFYLLLACFILKVISAQTSFYDSIQHQLQWRTFKIHLPTGYNTNSPFPLIIALHGGGHDADTMEFISKLSIKADIENFIVVYPNGKKFLIRTWNAGNCCGNSVSFNVDDVGFIVKMINKLKTDYNIDTTRIYLTGASNGGMMAYRLACERPDLFAAVVPVAATLQTTSSCAPNTKVPLLQIHSLPDTKVPFYGGYGTGYAGVYMPPIDSVLNVWAHINNCAISIDTFFNNNGAIGLKFNNCEYCYDVILYITSDGGHSWPGGNQTSNGDPVSGQIDATDIIWDFFKFKTLNCSTNNAQGSNSNNTIQIFPNPTNNLLNIYCKNDTELLIINIYNSLGDLLQTIIGENQIDVSNFESGFYYISVATNKNIFQSKFIKTN
ncbi:MAG TPA: PHB depolymerase family esterase [Bacteroidales bacterium]|jgi:polyhydroxybutyrate depolymerase|nr:PHB depolymerase family esterase [Bacteroidales bacterium]HUM33550.1 PHB depolymerase family esterase [Bacteroidales bacterium]